tara:strand:- start:30 stop:530 length:501 start_codon:yes stop_codon:yes gene_type:complete
MTFKNKILITLMLVGLIPVFISSAISVNFSSKALIDMGNNQLMSLQETKSHSVTSYLDTLSNGLSLLAENPIVVRMLPLLGNAYKRLNKIPVNDQNLDDVARFYDSEFKTRLSPDEASEFESDALISQLSPAAILLQSAYIAQNTNPVGEKDKTLNSQHIPALYLS